jgi:hypothetical protein
VGLGAYVNGTGATVNADVDALLTATDFGNGAVRSALLGTVTNSEFSIDVTSQAGVNVTISASGADSGASGLFEVLVAFMPQG